MRSNSVPTAPRVWRGWPRAGSTPSPSTITCRARPASTCSRKSAALPQAPPVIYVTGSEDSRVAVAALKAGAVDYVWKDVQGQFRELLGEAVATALRQEALRRDEGARRGRDARGARPGRTAAARGQSPRRQLTGPGRGAGAHAAQRRRRTRPPRRPSTRCRPGSRRSPASTGGSTPRTTSNRSSWTPISRASSRSCRPPCGRAGAITRSGCRPRRCGSPPTRQCRSASS